MPLRDLSAHLRLGVSAGAVALVAACGPVDYQGVAPASRARQFARNELTHLESPLRVVNLGSGPGMVNLPDAGFDLEEPDGGLIVPSSPSDLPPLGDGGPDVLSLDTWQMSNVTDVTASNCNLVCGVVLGIAPWPPEGSTLIDCSPVPDAGEPAAFCHYKSSSALSL